MSANVVWNIVRKSSSFRVKRCGVELSSEPGNVMNKNTFKWSGLAQAKTVDVSLDARGNPSLGVSAPKRANQPKNSRWVTRLTRGNLGKRNAAVKRSLGKAHFRRDLQQAALARLARLHLSRTRPGGVEKTPRARR